MTTKQNAQNCTTIVYKYPAKTTISVRYISMFSTEAISVTENGMKLVLWPFTGEQRMGGHSALTYNVTQTRVLITTLLHHGPSHASTRRLNVITWNKLVTSLNLRIKGGKRNLRQRSTSNHSSARSLGKALCELYRPTTVEWKKNRLNTEKQQQAHMTSYTLWCIIKTVSYKQASHVYHTELFNRNFNFNYTSEEFHNGTLQYTG